MVQLYRRTHQYFMLVSFCVCSCVLTVIPRSTIGGEKHGDEQGAHNPGIILVGDRDIQQVLDAAPSNAVVRCDPNRRMELSIPIRVKKPVSISGLHAQLPAGLGKTNLMIVEADDVHITDFTLVGNADSVPQDNRAGLLVIRSNNFVVENGKVLNSAKDGINISPSEQSSEFRNGIVRNILGRGNVRDVISIQGFGERGLEVGDLLVENIQAFDSRLRGAVEVSDGSGNVTVRKVYAESCVYGVDVQDHNKAGQINRNVLIDGLVVRDCDTALRTANRDFGHNNLTIRNVVGDRFRQNSRWRPLHITHTSRVLIDGVLLQNCVGEEAILLQNCDDATLRNITITAGKDESLSVLLENCHNAIIDGIRLNRDGAKPGSGIIYRIDADEIFKNLRITNVLAQGIVPFGILLENLSNTGSLDYYSISGNMGTIADRIQGQHAMVRDNMP